MRLDLHALIVQFVAGAQSARYQTAHFRIARSEPRPRLLAKEQHVLDGRAGVICSLFHPLHIRVQHLTPVRQLVALARVIIVANHLFEP